MARVVFGILDNVSRRGGVARRAVISALGHFFKLEREESHSTSTAPASLSSPWLREWEHLGTVPAEERQRAFYYTSFPLLCVRRCAPAWDLQRVTVPLEGYADDDSGVVGALRDIWECLWLSLTAQAYSMSVSLAGELAMVQIEILSYFHPNNFFCRWERIAGKTEAGATTTPRGVWFYYWLYTVFLTRVVVQWGQATVVTTENNNKTQKPQANDTENAITDRQICVWLQVPLEQLRVTVLPWLGAEAGGGGGDAALDRAMRNLSRAICELMAALMLFGILCSASTPLAWWASVREVVLDPFRDVSAVMRLAAAEGSSVSQRQLDGRCGNDASKENVMERYSFAVHIHDGLVQHYQMNAFSVVFLGQYVAMMSPLLIEAANASAQLFSATGAGECSIAIQCGSFLFQLLMLTSKIPSEWIAGCSKDDVCALTGNALNCPKLESNSEDITELRSSAPPAREAASPEPKTLIELLGPSAVGPLASFSLGCLRFSKTPALQDVGVKLFSAIISIAPELVVMTDEMVVMGAIAAVQGIARLHPNASTRQVAEQVLEHLPCDEQ